MEKFINDHIKNLKDYEPVESDSTLRSKYSLGNKEIIRLNANENPYGSIPEINSNLSKLNEQIKNVNSYSLGIDEKLSNFLSTQLNTQSSIFQLISKVNEQGTVDKETKKLFQDLNKSIQDLNVNNKK